MDWRGKGALLETRKAMWIKTYIESRRAKRREKKTAEANEHARRTIKITDYVNSSKQLILAIRVDGEFVEKVEDISQALLKIEQMRKECANKYILERL